MLLQKAGELTPNWGWMKMVLALMRSVKLLHLVSQKVNLVCWYTCICVCVGFIFDVEAEECRRENILIGLYVDVSSQMYQLLVYCMYMHIVCITVLF
jgi:hypothetical protein